MTILLYENEAEALLQLARRERRDPKRQVQWLVAKAAAEAGLLENESGNGATSEAVTVTRSAVQAAA